MDPLRKTRFNLRWPGFSWPKCDEWDGVGMGCGNQKTFVCQVGNLIEQLNTPFCNNCGSCSCNWAIWRKSGKLENLENNYILVKLAPIIVDFFSWHIVKFDFGLGNIFCGTVTSFILLRKFILCFWDKFVEKNGQKVGDFNITFQNESIFLRWQGFFLCFYTPLGL